jgi:DNA-binding transcriptional MerR regulator
MDDRDPSLLSIGRFARLTGLSIGALRHYDELDLLRPASVDAATGYRYYRADQLDDARTIVRLRDLEVPLDEVRSILGADDPAERRRRLDAHRRRIQARSDRLSHVLHHLSMTVDREESLMSTPPAAPELDVQTHRELGVGLFNRTWELIEMPDRTSEQDDEMIHTTHASRYHWGQVGEPVRMARGEWQCARVYSTLGRGEPAVWHARRCLAILEAHGPLDDWDLPTAYEALARAHAVAGDRATSDAWRARATAALRSIVDPEDRRIIEQDLATVP